MTPLMIGGTPTAGAGAAGVGSATAPTDADNFASVLAGASADPALTNPAAAPVLAVIHDGSSQTEEPPGTGAPVGRPTSHVQPDDPSDAADATVLAAGVAAAALALPVPVPVPVIPAAASAWSAGAHRPVADRLAPPAAVQASPAAGTLVATTSVTTAMPTTAMPTAAMPTTAMATGTRPITVGATAVSAAPQPSSTGDPVTAEPSVAGTRTAPAAPEPASRTAPAKPPTITTAAPASTASAVTGQPAGLRLAGRSTTPVSSTVSPASKPASTGSAFGQDPVATPGLAGRLEHQPNTGSDDRQHPSSRSATPAAVDSTAPAGPSGSTTFPLVDGGATNTSQSAAAAQPMTTAQPMVTAQPMTTSQPGTVSQQPAAAPVSHQLAGPVLSLRTAGDGNHQLIIALHPAELGPVNVHVRIIGDSMAIQLASSSADAHDALREALPQLRQELQAAGLHNVDLHAVEMRAIDLHAVDLHGVDLSLDLGGSAGGSGAQADPRTDQGYHPGQHDGPPVDRPVTAVPADRLVRNTDSGLDRWL